MVVVPSTTWISRETLSSVANLLSLDVLIRHRECHHGLVTMWLMRSIGRPAPDPRGSSAHLVGHRADVVPRPIEIFRPHGDVPAWLGIARARHRDPPTPARH